VGVCVGVGVGVYVHIPVADNMSCTLFNHKSKYPHFLQQMCKRPNDRYFCTTESQIFKAMDLMQLNRTAY